MLALYAVWRGVRLLTIRQVTGADRHARWVWDAQRFLHLPSELWLQRQVLPHDGLVQFFNAYYAGAHVPATIAAMVWLYVAARDRYPRVRNALALLTAACLVIRIFPVAPPRLLPDLGFVDTALAYDQSVYGTGGSGLSNVLAAMPSIHVGWALVVVVCAYRATTSRWRWLAVGHLVLTLLAVTVTANHWWLDGVVAGLLLWGAFGVLALADRLRSRDPSLLSAETSGGGGSDECQVVS